MVGGMAGRQIYEQTQRDRYVRPGVVRVCDPEPVDGRYGNAGYGGYRTGGATADDDLRGTTAGEVHPPDGLPPGDRIRVRVDVSQGDPASRGTGRGRKGPSSR